MSTFKINNLLRTIGHRLGCLYKYDIGDRNGSSSSCCGIGLWEGPFSTRKLTEYPPWRLISLTNETSGSRRWRAIYRSVNWVSKLSSREKSSPSPIDDDWSPHLQVLVAHQQCHFCTSHAQLVRTYSTSRLASPPLLALIRSVSEPVSLVQAPCQRLLHGIYGIFARRQWDTIDAAQITTVMKQGVRWLYTMSFSGCHLNNDDISTCLHRYP